jgi:hypothetical protein
MQYMRALSMAAFAVGAGIPACAVALPGDPPPAINQSPAYAGAAYWTPEKMAHAIPMDIHVATPANAIKQTAAPGATGEPGATSGTPPGSSPGPVATFRPKAAPAAANVFLPQDGAYPGPNDTYYYGPRFRTFPISTIGKLFFLDPQTNTNYQCSATATYGNASILSTIWTAGHCVGAGGGQRYYTNYYFCPSYDATQGGPNPQVGCWSWSTAQLTGGWYYGGSFTRDFAYIHATSTGSVLNENLISAVGGLGFAWNWARDQAWQHYGYPAQTPWSGGEIVVTTTEHRYDDSDSDSYGPATNAWGSGQTPGSSGSGVLLGFSYSGGSINSNVSFYYTSPTNEYGIMLHGPYYDTAACQFWQGGTGWTGTC